MNEATPAYLSICTDHPEVGRIYLCYVCEAEVGMPDFFGLTTSMTSAARFKPDWRRSPYLGQFGNKDPLSEIAARCIWSETDRSGHHNALRERVPMEWLTTAAWFEVPAEPPDDDDDDAMIFGGR